MTTIYAPIVQHDENAMRPTQVVVDLAQLTANYAAIQQRVGTAVSLMPILKANAYGHGLIPIAHHLQKLGAPYFGVAYLEEGMLLRQAGITTPILVLGGIAGNQIPLFIAHDLTMTASSVEKLELIENTAVALNRPAKIHLKIDTGMERIGVHYYSARPLLEAALTCTHCHIEGIYSHFANSDSADLSHARLQLERFQELLLFYDERSLPPPRLRHIANSGGILQLPESHLNMVRPGILLYGVYPSAEAERTVAVQPALTWKSRVVYFKVVQPGHPVSYGSTWQSDTQTRIVTVPVGYGDGYFRRLSNRAKVLIRGNAYPVVGRICMDQLMVNIGWETAYNGDEVVLIGKQGEACISFEEVAEWAETIPYEILTNINTRVPRLYLE
jgi:alanine racemase